jgi:lipooligosaccharide transport system ATP-binding protein
MAAIETRRLTKKFGDLTAVDDVNLEVAEGECFGLLGPNGAGKTSLIRMITAVSPPSAGDIYVLGKELKKHQRQVKGLTGIVPQIDNLDPDLSVLQNLLTFARYFSIPGDEARRRSIEALKLFELDNRQDSNIRELSGGMKRRLLIARGLINLPRILVLDEPTIGLDPQAKYLVWHKLTELKSQGVTQLLSTQNMEEAAALCDRVAVMHQGRILVTDTPQGLIDRYVGVEMAEIDVDSRGKEEIAAELRNSGADFEDAGQKIYVFHVDNLAGNLDKLSGNIQRRQATLEDVFFRFTGRSLLE